jgi:lauroyl/myristoyl acyltransferase
VPHYGVGTSANESKVKSKSKAILVTGHGGLWDCESANESKVKSKSKAILVTGHGGLWDCETLNIHIF